MKSGALSLITEGQDIDPTDFPLEEVRDGTTLRSSLRMRGGQETFGGMTVRRGRTMKEDLVDVQTRHINAEGELETDREVTEKQVNDTEFYKVDNEFVITESTGDEDARDLLSRAMNGSVVQAEIDVVEFAKANPNMKIKLSGTDHGSNVDHLTAVGDIQHASDLPNDVRDYPNVMLGFEGLQWERRSIRGFVSKSGYIAVYDPSEMDTEEYCRFIRAEVMPYARAG